MSQTFVGDVWALLPLSPYVRSALCFDKYEILTVLTLTLPFAVFRGDIVEL